MPIVDIDMEKCMNCGSCIEICPMDVLRDGDSVPLIRYGEDCQSCFLCRLYCSTGAITVNTERARPSPLPW